jgi:trehalose 6-phosphate phosphatase
VTIHPGAEAAIPHLKAALDQLAARIAGRPELNGVLIEDKGASASVHYRLTPDRDAAHVLLTSMMSEIAEPLELKVTHGRMVVELRPPVAVNKGAALRRIVELYALQSVIFIGDDVTDIDGFEAAEQLRMDEGKAALSIAVADPEARPDVVEAADASVESVTACVTLLVDIGRALDGGVGD